VSEAPPAPLRRSRILLVEDDPADVRLTLEVFREGTLKPQIDVVSDGIEALAYLRGDDGQPPRGRPDLILLDLNLPRMDGRELLAALKSDASLRSIPILVLTTSSAPHDIARCYELRAASVILKPVDLDGFQRVVRAVEGFWLSLVRLEPGA
jgi:two-component system, chemotaxis family, response regulator Rcp1